MEEEKHSPSKFIPPSTALTIEKNPLNDLHIAILKERAARRQRSETKS
jgi:hypothetical protein